MRADEIVIVCLALLGFWPNGDVSARCNRVRM